MAASLAHFVVVVLERTRFLPTGFQDTTADAPGPEMLWLPGGTFTMGSPDGVGEDNEHPAHAVKLSHYAVGRYPVTVGEFKRFVEATEYVTEAEQGDGAYDWNRGQYEEKEDASWHKPYMDQDDTHPVTSISRNDAKAYCDWLSEETGQQYGLLTEAQWEHACRVGEQGRWSFGDDEEQLGDYAWYRDNAGDGTHPVGEKDPNAWQLHDMHGNVWEWCADWFNENTYKQRAAADSTMSIGPEDAVATASGDGAHDINASNDAAAYSYDDRTYIFDPVGPYAGSYRVIRGGSWGVDADHCRSACRSGGVPSSRHGDLGFRLSRTGPLHSYPFTVGRDEGEQPEPIPTHLTGLHDTLADGSQAPAMVWLRGGRFTMGQDDSPYDDEKPAHTVEVSAFSIGQYPLTFDEYDRFCEATGRDKPQDQGWGRGQRPVINISWDDARSYCDWLNVQQQAGIYRLLTEAEWEFACRAGSETYWYFGDDENQLGKYAWFQANSEGTTHPVGEKRPNAWQLHDMHGNVWEWCADWYNEGSYAQRPAAFSSAADAAPTSAAETVKAAAERVSAASSIAASRGDAAAAIGATDPSGAATGSHRVIYGGSWYELADGCRSACRYGWRPSNRDDNLGFRLSRTGPWPSYPFTLFRGDEGTSEHRDEAQEVQAPRAETFEPQQRFRDRFVIVRKDGRAEPAGAEQEGPEMVYLPGGTFLMGDERGAGNEKPTHRVALDAFAIGRTPVTWGEYRRFCEHTDEHWPEWLDEGNKYRMDKGSNDYYTHRGVARDALELPVVGVSWNDAVAYCAWLAERTDRPYRLPTEAEWEYACRAGTETRWSFGNDEKALKDYAWYSGNAGGKLHPVGQKRSNPWGLRDIHGNVWEWCADWYADWYAREAYRQRAVSASTVATNAAESSGEATAADATLVSPTGPSEGSYRVIRGGSWYYDADYCRSAVRDWRHPSGRHYLIGFRLSRTV